MSLDSGRCRVRARYASEAGSAVCPASSLGYFENNAPSMPGLADRLVHFRHLPHQVPESLILADLPPGLLQLWTRPQVPGTVLPPGADLSDPRTPTYVSNSRC